MIKFFRHIRKDLMEKNKTGKYLKYAIGEIVLVMIGILLALQVNIWNEKRKVSNDIDRVFTLLETELENNIRDSNGLMSYAYRKDSISALFRDGKVTRKMMWENLSLSTGDFQTFTRFIQDERLNEIIAQEKQLSNYYQSLMPELKRLKTRIESRRFWESEALSLSMQRYKEFADQTPWFNGLDSLAINNIITRSLEDKIYRNKVEHYNALQLDENVWDGTLIRTSSVALLWELKSTKDETLEIEKFLKNLNLKPFIEYECNEAINKAYNAGFRRNLIIYNTQSKEVTLQVRSKTGVFQSHITIPAESFHLRGQFALGKNDFLELEENENCRKVFDPYNEDYLIL